MRKEFLLWVESAATSCFAVLFILTLVSRDWIEEVFGIDPDRHSGLLEWLIAAVMLVAAVGAGTLARRQWRRLQADPAANRT